jgi:poly(3-hydroxybutyrate) depolymerase
MPPLLNTSSMKIIAWFLLFYGHTVCLTAQQIANSTTAANGTFIGFYEFKPYNYNTTNTPYPLIIFLHGVGERGNGTTELSRVLSNAIPRLCANGATMTFNYNGTATSFIVLSPQLSSSQGNWDNVYTEAMINYAQQSLRIDPDRIYLCGLSLGGGGVWKFATATASNARTLAAIAPVCATSEGTVYCNIAQQALPVWAFHAEDDATVNVGNTRYVVNQINNCNPIIPPLTTYYLTGGHGIWDAAFDTTHNIQNPNVYEWLLQQSRRATSITNPVLPTAPSTHKILKIYPNPSPSKSITLYHLSPAKGTMLLTIFDATGRAVWEDALGKNQPSIYHTINTTNFATGVFYVQLQEPKGILLNTRFIKQ